MAALTILWRMVGVRGRRRGFGGGVTCDEKALRDLVSSLYRLGQLALNCLDHCRLFVHLELCRHHLLLERHVLRLLSFELPLQLLDVLFSGTDLLCRWFGAVPPRDEFGNFSIPANHCCVRASTGLDGHIPEVRVVNKVNFDTCRLVVGLCCVHAVAVAVRLRLLLYLVLLLLELFLELIDFFGRRRLQAACVTVNNNHLPLCETTNVSRWER